MSFRMSPPRGQGHTWKPLAEEPSGSRLWLQVRRRDENMWQPPACWSWSMEDTLGRVAQLMPPTPAWNADVTAAQALTLSVVGEPTSSSLPKTLTPDFLTFVVTSPL